MIKLLQKDIAQQTQRRLIFAVQGEKLSRWSFSIDLWQHKVQVVPRAP